MVAANRSGIATTKVRTSVAPEGVQATMLLAAGVGTERAAKGATVTTVVTVAWAAMARMPMARNLAMVATATLAANARSAPPLTGVCSMQGRSHGGRFLFMLTCAQYWWFYWHPKAWSGGGGGGDDSGGGGGGAYGDEKLTQIHFGGSGGGTGIDQGQ